MQSCVNSKTIRHATSFSDKKKNRLTHHPVRDSFRVASLLYSKRTTVKVADAMKIGEYPNNENVVL